MAAKRELTAENQAELGKLWKRLVSLYHPDRFAHEPDKLETYGKLTAAINRAKADGDIDTLRQIANDPHGFILRQGWTNLDFRDEEHVAKLRKLWESLEAEILGILEATNQLRESPDFELQGLIAREPALFDRIVAQHTERLEAEAAKLRAEAEALAKETEELTGRADAGP